MDKPDESYVMVYIEEYDTECAVNIIDIDVDKTVKLSLELEFAPQVTYPR